MYWCNKLARSSKLLLLQGTHAGMDVIFPPHQAHHLQPVMPEELTKGILRLLVTLPLRLQQEYPWCVECNFFLFCEHTYSTPAVGA